MKRRLGTSGNCWEDRGKSGRGRPRCGYVKALSEWARVDAKETSKTTKSRVEWKTMTVSVLKEQGT